MKLSLRSLLTWQGTTGRGQYVLVGILGFALKHNLDRFIATFAFNRPWSIFNYWVPPDDLVRWSTLSVADRNFLLTMLGVSLPFIWVGVLLTMKRLRDAQLPGILVAFFFFPFLNLIFFLLLAVLPSRPARTTVREPGSARKFLDAIIPRDGPGSAAGAVITTVLFALAATGLGVFVFIEYGWGIFVGLPFVTGLLAALLFGYHRPRRYGECFAVASLAVTFLGLILLALAMEGVICLFMAAPNFYPVAWLGAFVGWAIQARPTQRDAPSVLVLLILAMPLLMGAESRAARTAPRYRVETSIEIAAPPEEVWRHIVTFQELPEPTDSLFRVGIAYPMRARIEGTGVGAVRYCEFSTGAFIEPIEVWKEPRLLRFSVRQNPAPMKEWSPYREIHAPHLEGFFVSDQGEFRLERLPGGGTRVTGTTWYRHNMWPAGYWRLFSDPILHRIHWRVLTHIKRSAEA